MNNISEGNPSDYLTKLRSHTKKGSQISGHFE